MSEPKNGRKTNRLLRSLAAAAAALALTLLMLALSALLLKNGTWGEDRTKIILPLTVFASNLIPAVMRGRGEKKGAASSAIVQSVFFLLLLSVSAAAGGKSIMEPVKNASFAVACVLGCLLGKVTILYKSDKRSKNGIKIRRNITRSYHA